MPIRITGLNSGLDTESIISALVSSYNYKTDKYKKAQTKISWKQDAWKALNTKIYSLYDSVGKMRYSSAYAMKTASVSDSTKAKVSVGNGAVNGTQTLQITSVAASGYLTGGRLDTKGKAATGETTLKDLGYTNGDAEITVTDKVDGTLTKITLSGDTKVSDFVKQLNEAGVKASFDAKNQRIFVSSAATGEKNDFSLKSSSEAADNALKALGLLGAETASNTTDTSKYNTDSSRVMATDAKIILNGAEYTSETNEFEVNGVSITAMAVTGKDETLTLSVATDNEAIYDNVKDFITQYNALMNEMTNLYNAPNAKGYEPLTADEKDQMSDTEIEQWEKKIKDSILRRDDTLSGLMSSMQTAMSKSYTINGKSYNLSTFGIQTLGLSAAKNEQNAYHIDGDEDDAATSGKQDKLMAAIKNDPDGIIDFMKELSKELYGAIDQKMKSTSLSSSYTVYNDKEMASEYSDYTALISKWEKKLAQQEDYYYKKFAAMESMLAKINSQTSSLSGLFGGM